MKSELAINGGPKVRERYFPTQNTYGPEEMEATRRVMRGGRLSWYRGNWGPAFFGGPEIQALESEWERRWNVRHAICCNSATSGLHIALGALSVGHRDKVIVSPYSMTCSATMPLAWGAEPIFADVEPDCFCLDYESVKVQIEQHGKSVKAIIAVSLFGQPFDHRLTEFGIPIVEDAAQALGSCLMQSPEWIYAGDMGAIGIYSFNYGKHLTCGEGGMVVTNSDDLAMRCRLIMNHAESVINDSSENKTLRDSRLLFGFNLRMTEIHAAIIREQLKKFDVLQQQRQMNVDFLNNQLKMIPAITPAPVRKDCTHTYYVLPYLWDSAKAEGLHRDKFIEAVKAELAPREDRDTEGIQIGCGYITPLYRLPLFDEPIRLPNVEVLWKDRLFLTLYHAPTSTLDDMADVALAFCKVWNRREELR